MIHSLEQGSPNFLTKPVFCPSDIRGCWNVASGSGNFAAIVGSKLVIWY